MSNTRKTILAYIVDAILLLIIGFALYEAWKMNAKVDFSLHGPYDVVGSD